MQFALEVRLGVLECSFLNHSQGIFEAKDDGFMSQFEYI
jgi:hypothetical protein